MDSTALRAMQAPLKDRYKGDPKSAFITLKAKGSLDDAHIACKVDTGRAIAMAGLQQATGGSRPGGCFGRILLEEVGGCARGARKRGQTAVALPVQSGSGRAE